MLLQKVFLFILCLQIVACVPVNNKSNKSDSDNPQTEITEAGAPEIQSPSNTNINSGGVTPTISQQSTGGSTPVYTTSTISLNISGTLRYERVPVGISGKLEFHNTSLEFIRNAKVQAVSPATGLVLDEGETDEFGVFSLIITDEQLVQIIVYAQSEKYNIKIQNNDNSNAIYSYSTNTYNPFYHNNYDAVITTGWLGDNVSGSYEQKRRSAPFAILDTYVGACKTLRVNQIKLNMSEVDYCSKALKVNWAENSLSNYKSTFNHFDNQLYIKGLENVDTDEYDQHVLLNVFTKHFLKNYSRNDSLDGTFTSSTTLSIEQVFVEGLSQAMAGILLNDKNYINTGGVRSQGIGLGITEPKQALDQFTLDLSNQVVQNPYSPITIREFFWHLNDDINGGKDNLTVELEKILVALKTSDFTQTSALATIYSFTNNFLDHYSYYRYSTEILASAYGITLTNAYGNGELNDFSGLAKIPFYQQLTVGNPDLLIQFAGNSLLFNESKNVNRLYFSAVAPADDNTAFQIQIESDFPIFVEVFNHGQVAKTAPLVPILMSPPPLNKININICDPAVGIEDEYIIRLSNSIGSLALIPFSAKVKVVKLATCP